jgi:CHRD domain
VSPIIPADSGKEKSGMSRLTGYVSMTVALLTLMIPVTGSADDNRTLRINLSGFNEVHPPTLGIGAIFSTGTGQLTLKVNKQAREIAYELTYVFPDAAATPIVGTQFVNQAHFHFGQQHTTGAINVWLCQSLDTPAPAAVAASTPTCPSPSGTVSGIVTPAKVLALAPQGFPAGEDGFDALLAAIRNHAIYANVHTDRFPPGEIRGQVGEHVDD